MQAYLDLMRKVLDEGEFRESRAGDTISIFGAHFEHDLSEGFPILTTKKVAFNTFAKEMKLFLQGSNNLKDYLDMGVNFWSPDAYRWYISNHPESTLTFEEYVEKCKVDERYGDLGKLYGYQWASWEAPRKPVKVEPRIKEKQEIKPREVKLLTPVGDNELIGQIYESDKYGKYQVIEVVGKDKHSRKLYKIQFLQTGTIVDNVRADVVKEGCVKDRYSPTNSGVGYLGEYKVVTTMDKHLHKTWSHMLERCYNPNCKEYKYYGAKGVFVDKRWHNFSNFVVDVKKLPNWNRKIREKDKWQLDKDYYHSNCYSKDTCVWLTKSDNILYRTSKAFEVTTPNGDTFIEICQMKVARDYNLNSPQGTNKISLVLKGERKHTKGFKFRYIEDGELYRYPLPINQIQNVINEIKTNPTSRRILFHAWNVAETEEMVLVPCHTLYQFYVSQDRKLSAHLYQRSADVFLGLPANITNLALLTHLIAEHCGLDVGKIRISFGDLHIYQAHLPACIKQLQREPKELPELIIRQELRSLEDIADFELSSISLLGYEHHGVIKAPLLVGEGK